MRSNKKYSYWIVGIIMFIILLLVIPWENVLPSGPKVGVIEIKMPILDSKKIVEDLNYFQQQ